MSKAEEILQEIYLKETEHIANIRTPRVPAYLEPVVLKAMGAYALACLEKAAENATISEWTLEIDKASITSKDNLV